MMRVVVRPRVDGGEVHEDGQDRTQQGADGDIPHRWAAHWQLYLNLPSSRPWFDAIWQNKCPLHFCTINKASSGRKKAAAQIFQLGREILAKSAHDFGVDEPKMAALCAKGGAA